MDGLPTLKIQTLTQGLAEHKRLTPLPAPLQREPLRHIREQQDQALNLPKVNYAQVQLQEEDGDDESPDEFAEVTVRPVLIWRPGRRRKKRKGSLGGKVTATDGHRGRLLGPPSAKTALQDKQLPDNSVTHHHSNNAVANGQQVIPPPPDRYPKGALKKIFKNDLAGTRTDLKVCVWGGGGGGEANGHHQKLTTINSMLFLSTGKKEDRLDKQPILKGTC